MFYLITKTIISAIIIVAISEVSKRSSLFGSILASLPLISFLGMIWLYIDTGSIEKVSRLSKSVFWMVLPSLSLFLVLPLLLRAGLSFYLALFLSTLSMVVVYFIMVYVLKGFGISL